MTQLASVPCCRSQVSRDDLLAEHVRKALSEAPPLTETQRRTVARLLAARNVDRER